jgi:hypothetical protein
MAKKRKTAELTMQRALDDVLETADLARAAGQYAASITAQKAIAGELFNLFRDRKEIDVNIELRARNKVELRALLVEEYGEELTEAIWQSWTGPKLIEGTVAAEIDLQEPMNHDHDIGLNGPVNAVNGTRDSTQRSAVRSALPRAPAQKGNMAISERKALESVANSSAPFKK